MLSPLTSNSVVTVICISRVGESFLPLSNDLKVLRRPLLRLVGCSTDRRCDSTSSENIFSSDSFVITLSLLKDDSLAPSDKERGSSFLSAYESDLLSLEYLVVSDAADNAVGIFCEG